MNEVKGTSVSERWVGATMYAPPVGNRSAPMIFTRKTGMQHAITMARTTR